MTFRGNPYLRATAASFLAALLAFGVAKLNIADAESSSDRASEAAIQRISAPFYGRWALGQARISVVYLDDIEVPALVDSVGWQDWPPSFGDFARIIDNLVGGDQKPRALFVDFVFTGEAVDEGQAEACSVAPRRFAPECGYWRLVGVLRDAAHTDVWEGFAECRATPVAQLACTIAAGGVPVILARSSPIELPRWNPRQRRLAASAVFSPALVDQHAYPLRDAYCDEFPGTVGCDQGPRGAGSIVGDRRKRELGILGYDISPAAALYAASCLTAPADCDDPTFDRMLQAAHRTLKGDKAVRWPDWPKGLSQPVGVVWGARAPVGQSQISVATTGKPLDCARSASRPLTLSWSGVRDGLGELVLRAAGEIAPPLRKGRQECLYAYNVSYAALVSGHNLSEDVVTRLIKDKLVLFGAQFRASNDWMASPVQQQIPGVYTHAMALDNLLESGANYRRVLDDKDDSGGADDRGDYVETLLVFALAMLGFSGAIRRNRLVSRFGLPDGSLTLSRVVPIYLIIVGLSALAILLVTIVTMCVLRSTPINWIGVSGVALTYSLFAMRESLTHDVGAALARNRRTRWLPRAWSAAIAWLDVARPPQPPKPPPPRRSKPQTPASRRKRIERKGVQS